tara:strand:+ start:370 stop:855 length:486 start_codon:yes stop_codon:yes gene_type:complete
MSKYLNSVVYKIYSKNPEDDQFYVGSTYDLNLRMRVHKQNCRNAECAEFHYKVYKHIRANGGWDNFIMEKIDDTPCESRRELDVIEQGYMDKLNSQLNSNRAYQTNEQRKEQKQGLNKAYYQTHKEQLKKKFTCECGGKYTNSNITHHIKTKKHQNYINLI